MLIGSLKDLNLHRHRPALHPLQARQASQALLKESKHSQHLLSQAPSLAADA